MTTLVTRQVALPIADLLVISSGIQHDHAVGDYRTRRAECEAAARQLNVMTLRELSVADLPRIAQLPAPLDRRVRHVVTENARVLATVNAFATGDLAPIAAVFRDSQRSMRDDYEVSIPAIDTLVEITVAHPEVYGARLTGGGFGGSIVALAVRGAGARLATQICERYHALTGHTGQVLLAGEITPCNPS